MAIKMLIKVNYVKFYKVIYFISLENNLNIINGK